MYSYGGPNHAFPKEFGNYERLDMSGCTGPLYEFPVKAGAIYSNYADSCRPGENRVIMNACGELCAVVTHRGAATPNGFVLCTVYH